MSEDKKISPYKPDTPCVYILQCKDNTLYTGWTNNFEKRLAAHSSGKGAKYTKGRGPFIPVYIEYFPDKISATKREAAIKKLTPQKKRQLIASHQNQLYDDNGEHTVHPL